MAKKLTPAEAGIAAAETVQKMIERKGAKLDKTAARAFFIAFAQSMSTWLLLKRMS